MQYTPNPTALELSQGNGVQVLYTYPPEGKFQNLGVIDFTFWRPGWRQPTVTDTLPELKDQVRLAGGNALIVRDQRMHDFNKRKIIVSAEVLKVAY